MPKLCPVCDSGPLQLFCETPNVPVFCNVLWATKAEALAAPRGDIRLGFCAHCGHVYNAAFDPQAVAYSPHYENSLHFSPHFQRYAEALANRLVATYGLHNKDIIEIGCGKGEFLSLLCKAGNNRGLGFDASFDPERLGPAPAGLTVIRDHYTPAHQHHPADLLVCRHVLEHIAEPKPFVKGVYEATARQKSAAVYFEVPNALFNWEDLGIWDLIYEHCSYFCPSSLAHLFRAQGFALSSVHIEYGNQFLCLEAQVRGDDRVGPVAPSPQALALLIQKFQDHREAKVKAWRQQLADLTTAKKRVALWGTGSKGVTFLNVIPEAQAVSVVLDLNPNKHGRYVPGTGHVVTSPTDHAAGSLDAVLIMNPVYESEIRSQLQTLGHSTQVLVV